MGEIWAALYVDGIVHLKTGPQGSPRCGTLIEQRSGALRVSWPLVENGAGDETMCQACRSTWMGGGSS
jgi:hypothetical protein